MSESEKRNGSDYVNSSKRGNGKRNSSENVNSSERGNAKRNESENGSKSGKWKGREGRHRRAEVAGTGEIVEETREKDGMKEVYGTEETL